MKATLQRLTRPRRRARRRLLIGLLVLPVVVLAALAYGLLHTPSWYAPPLIAPDDRQDVRNDLTAAEQALTESLRSIEGPFIYHIYQDNVNRWLAMRREIYPLIDELTPSALADPFVRFDDGTVTVAGRYAGGPVDVIVSVEFTLGFEDGDIMLRKGAIRSGSIPFPINAGNVGFSGPIRRDPDDVWPGSPPISGDLANGLRVGADAWWKNGGMRYRVRDVTVRPGRIDIEVESLGRQSPAERKRQS
jgi:hypothetical protein